MIVLVVHSYLRWVVLALGATLLAVSAHGWARGKAWERGHERLHVIFIAVVDTQFLLGLLLYLWLSPLVRGFYANLGFAMKDAVLRFFGVEHVFSMVVAIALLHIVRATSKRMPASTLRHRRVCSSTLAAFALMLIAVPWPMLPYGRPLLRGL